MPNIRDYLEVRTASPASFSPDGETLLVLSDLTGTQQLYRVPRAGGAPEAVTSFPEPVGGAYLPSSRRVVMTMDDGGNERHQIYLLDEDGGNLERGVPCHMLVYPDEGHGLAKLANRLDAYPKAVDFLDEHLGMGPTTQ